MAEADLIVASAVVVPEDAQPPPQTSPLPPEHGESLKRRQSSISSVSSKRPRLSVGGGSPSQDAPERAPSRKSSLQMDAQEERRRGRRLFGAVLGTLSQSSTTAAQRRRADIEKKQQAKLQAQAEEDKAVRQQRLDELQRKRRKEQLAWHEKSMKIQHDSMRATAKFLRTDAEPRLYYKPYELRAEEEERITQQMEEVEETIGRELEEWDVRTRRVQEEQAGHSSNQQRNDAQNTEKGEDIGAAGENRVKDVEQSTTEDGQKEANGTDDDIGATEIMESEAAPLLETNGTANLQVPADPESEKDAADDVGEVIQGEEDTVIY